mgnify:CR=1 FL=1
MKKYLIIIAIFLFYITPAKPDVISGNIKEDVEATKKNQVVDSKTGMGVDKAKVSFLFMVFCLKIYLMIVI